MVSWGRLAIGNAIGFRHSPFFRGMKLRLDAGYLASQAVEKAALALVDRAGVTDAPQADASVLPMELNAARY